jgi:hypothetical protein
MASYRPPVKTGGTFGPQGVAKIEVHPADKNKIRFQLRERKWDRATNTESFVTHKGTINRSDCPEAVRKLIRAGIWYVSVGKDLDKIYTVRPVKGVFSVKVSHFSRAEGQPPAPKDKVGVQFPYQYFTVILKIVEGDEAGMEVPYTLRYHFTSETEYAKDGSKRTVLAFDHAKSKYTPPLMDFLDAAGAWENGAMPYKDNVLPMLEKRILEQGRTFQVLLDDGQVKSIVGGHSEDFGFAPDVEE